MVYRSSDVVDHAVAVLDQYGLGDLSMRRLAGELGIQPSALYHHFGNKQLLLAAVADELIARGYRPGRHEDWAEAARGVCIALREAMLAYRDGAELVATVVAFGLGGAAPYRDLRAALSRGGADDTLAQVGARTLLHFVFGHVAEEQTHLQASSAGAIDDDLAAASDFTLGVDLVLDGLSVRIDRHAATSSH